MPILHDFDEMCELLDRHAKICSRNHTPAGAVIKHPRRPSKALPFARTLYGLRFATADLYLGFDPSTAAAGAQGACVPNTQP